MNIVINALPYKKNSSGIGTMIRELYGAYAGVTLRKCQIIMPHDSPEFSTGGQCELIRMPWNYDQGFRRILFQAFAMGRRCCRNAVLLTTDSKCPFFLPKSCTSIPLITDLAVYIGDLTEQPLDELVDSCQDEAAMSRVAVAQCAGCWNVCEVANEMNYWNRNGDEKSHRKIYVGQPFRADRSGLCSGVRRKIRRAWTHPRQHPRWQRSEYPEPLKRYEPRGNVCRQYSEID